MVSLVAAFSVQLIAEPLFWGDLKAGPYAVGFRTVLFSSGELHVWFPAVAADQSPMRFGDYLRLSRDFLGGVNRFWKGDLELRQTLAIAISGKEDGLTSAQEVEILNTPMAARRDAQPFMSRFPLVLWTHRYATTVAQSVISEYLASHGFVVVYAAENTPPPMPFSLNSSAEKRKELDRQVSRLQRALSEAQRLPFVRVDRIGVLAWSYAGEAAHALQEEDSRVAIVVGLSSNVLSGWVYRPEILAGLRPDTITAPYLLITEPLKDGTTGPSEEILKQAKAPMFVVRMPKMKHGAFNALEGMVPSLMNVRNVQRWSLSGQDAKLGYEIAAQYVHRAVAHYLVALPTADTPFALWGPDGKIPDGFAVLETTGTARPVPAQPKFTSVEFQSGDKVTVSADLYPVRTKRAPIVVLVHQSGASRGEYRQIAPRLNAMGFNALAIDSRWGKRDRWNLVTNETAKRYGTDAIVVSGDRERIRAINREKDTEAAVRWVRQQGFSGPLILWGSSITANGVLKIASAGPGNIAAVLAFSPGEYNSENKTEMQSQVKELRIPLLMVCGEDEDQSCSEVFRAVPDGHKQYYHAVHGRHGSSILLDDPENWDPVEKFLQQFLLRPSAREANHRVD
jgi:dienelactone hydrolase